MRYRRTGVPGATYFFTLVTHNRAPIFSHAVQIENWRRAVEKVQSQRPFTIDAEVVLPDHIHCLWTLPPADTDYATRIRLVKTHVTKQCASLAASTNVSRLMKGERDVWQRRYWEHVIRDEHDFQQHVDYIHFNPVRHGFVESPRDWTHSTFSAWVARGDYEADWRAADEHQWPDWLLRGETPERR
jgi:putative transposase